jgi:DNA invertase Pin-like site-specific DNA recombinase
MIKSNLAGGKEGGEMGTPEHPLAGIRFIVAARQSRKPRAGQDIEFPIEVQDSRAKSWAEAQGGEYIGTAADFRSGTVAPWDRKNLRQWVDEKGDKVRQYDAIVATKADRISRGKNEDFSMIEAWAVRNQKNLIIVGPEGGIQYPARHDADFWQWTAEKRRSRQEWEVDRERSMNRQIDLRTRGKLSGGAIPFGYEVSGTKYDKTITPTDEGREWAPEIFKRVKNGKSLAAIAAWLKSEGVKPLSWQAWNKQEPDKRGPEPSIEWSPKTISQMIRNSTYVGQRKADAIINGKRLRGQGVIRIEVEAIVDTGLWFEANKKLDNAPRRGRRGPKTGEPALLTGVLSCGNCGAPMYRLKVRGGYVYYRCHGKLPRPKGCGVLVTASLLDFEVDKMMRASELWVYEWLHHPGEEVQIQADIDAIRLKLLTLPTMGLSEDEEDAERAKLRAQRRELESQLEDAKSDRWEKSVVLKEDGTPLTDAERWETADLAGKREILKERRVTFRWIEVDGQRKAEIIMVPLWTAEPSIA